MPQQLDLDALLAKHGAQPVEDDPPEPQVQDLGNLLRRHGATAAGDSQDQEVDLGALLEKHGAQPLSRADESRMRVLPSDLPRVPEAPRYTGPQPGELPMKPATMYGVNPQTGQRMQPPAPPKQPDQPNGWGIADKQQFLRRAPTAARGTAFNPAISADRVERAARAPVAGAHQTATATFWGPFQAASDALGVGSLAAWAKEQAEGSRATTEAIRGPKPVWSSGVEDAIFSGLESIGGMAPAVAAGMATGNPMVSYGVMGLSTGGAEYTDIRRDQPNLHPAQALVHSLSQGLVEAATERIPAIRLLDDLAKNTGLMKTVMRQLAAEVPGEQAATALQDLNDWATKNPDKPFQSYLDARPSAIGNTLVSTLVATIGMTGGLVAVQSAAETMAARPKGQGQPAAPGPVAAQPAPAEPVLEVRPLQEFEPETILEARPKAETLEEQRARQAAAGLVTSPDGRSLTSPPPISAVPPEWQTPEQQAAAEATDPAVDRLAELDAANDVGKAIAEAVAPDPLAASRGTAPAPVAEAPTVHKFASTQTNLPPGVAAEVQQLGKDIPDADLAGKGRETESHITVKYGLKTDDVAAVRQLLADEPPIRVTLGKTGTFEGVEDGTADAVFVKIESADLQRLNQKIAGAFETEDTHPDYKPHATIAYVKPGKGQGYAGNDELEGQEVLLESLTFSGRDGQQHTIPLTGQRQAAKPAAAAPSQKAVEDMTDEELAALVIEKVEGKQEDRVIPPPVEAPKPEARSPEQFHATQRGISYDQMTDDELRELVKDGIGDEPATAAKELQRRDEKRPLATMNSGPNRGRQFRVTQQDAQNVWGRFENGGTFVTSIRNVDFAKDEAAADRAQQEADRLGNTPMNELEEFSNQPVKTGQTVQLAHGAEVAANTSMGSVEVKFPAKPSQELLDKLKAAGFRWAKGNKRWYRKGTTVEATQKLLGMEAPATETATKPTKAALIPTRAPGGGIQYVVQPLREGAKTEELTLPEPKPVTPQVEPTWKAALPEFVGAQYKPPINRDERWRAVRNAARQAGVDISQTDTPEEAEALVGPALQVASEQRDVLLEKKAANKAKRDELIKKLKKDLGSQLNAAVDPTHVATMIGIVRTYLDDGVVEVQRVALKLQADWQDVTGDSFPAKLRAYFAAAWELLRKETIDLAQVFGPEGGRDAVSTVEGRPASEAGDDGQGSGTARSGDSPGGVSAPTGRPAADSSEGAGPRGAVGGPRRVRGGQEVRPTEVGTEQLEADPENTAPAMGADRYRITDADAIGTGTARERVNRNMAAIRVVKLLEKEQRRATPDEQAILVKYVGWGGLSRIFESWKHGANEADNRYWYQAHEDLKGALTDAEYRRARNSTQNAHYTSPTVIRAMWDAVRRLGVRSGNALEPSAGIGHFVGLAPEDLQLPFALVEKDTLTAAIAKALYPGSFTQATGFEQATLPSNHFSLVISNVPFGLIAITDPLLPGVVKQRIHNYFFAKALDKVAPGGLVAFVTSHGTLDASDQQGARAYIAHRADLIGVMRLPWTAFAGNAGTEVITDILFLRKRAEGETANHIGPWVDSSKVTLKNKEGQDFEHYVNELIQARPDLVLGEQNATGKMRGHANGYNVVPTEGQDFAAALAAAVATLPEGIIKPVEASGSSVKELEAAQAPVGARPFEFVERNGDLGQVVDGQIVPSELKPADQERVKALLPVRAAQRDVYAAMAEGDQKALTAAQKALTKSYRAFVKAHGPVSRQSNWTPFREDPDAPMLLALEHYDEESDTAEESPLFTMKTAATERAARTADTPNEALMMALGETGRIDLDRVGALLKVTPEQAATTLEAAGDIIHTPSGYQLPAVYLSGNVRVKLKEAEAAAALDPVYQPAVEKLKTVIPEDLPAHKINLRLGAPWVPVSYVEAFVAEISSNNGRGWQISYTSANATWGIDGSPSSNSSRFETEDVTTKDLLLDALNDRRRTVKRVVGDGADRVTVVDKKATNIARQRKEDLHKAFADYMLKQPGERRDWAVRAYNDAYNTYVTPNIDGSWLTFPGMTPYWREHIDPHQRNAVARILLTGNTLLAHVVGAGKTLTMIAAMMEMKRMGLARKPMMVVPNHLITQIPGEFLQHYPEARILVATPDDLQKEHRKRFTARVASGNYDAVVMPYSAFVRVSMSAEAETAYQQEMLDEIETAIISAWQAERENGYKEGKKTPPSVKRLENMRDRIQVQLDKLAARPKDDMLTFEETNVDALFVDEAHSFKNLYFPTRQQAAGIPSPQQVQRASDMYLKARYLNQVSHYRNVVLATGTPVANSMAEIYVMQKLLQENVLERAGINQFDNWLAQFGLIKAETELSATGTGMKARARLKYFRNLPDLAAMFRQVADVKMIDDLPALKARRPALKGKEPTPIEVPLNDQQSALLADLVTRADNLDPKNRKSDNMPMITGDGRLGMLDMRLLDRRTPEADVTKVAVVAERVAGIYKAWADKKGTQIVFLDSGTPGSEERAARLRDDEDAQGNPIKRPPTERERNRGFDLYRDLKKKLVAAGVKASEIAVIHDLDDVSEKKRDGARKALFSKVRKGEIRVLIGSTGKMGTGMNVQTKLVALHHMDPAWKPSDIEQRNGRILRQGNEFARDIPGFEVEILTYVTVGEGTQFGMDAYMWQLNEAKATIIAKFFAGNLSERDLELDLEQTVLTAGSLKAIGTGNPLVIEYAQVMAEVERLEQVKEGYEEQRREADYQLDETRRKIASEEAYRDKARKTAEAIEPAVKAEERVAVIRNETIEGHTDIGEAIVKAAEKGSAEAGGAYRWPGYRGAEGIGTYRGLALWLSGDSQGSVLLTLRHPKEDPRGYRASDDTYANAVIDMQVPDPEAPGGRGWRDPKVLMNGIEQRLQQLVNDNRESFYHKSLLGDLATYESVLANPFEQQDALTKATARKEELEKLLGYSAGGQVEVDEIDEDESGTAAGEIRTTAGKVLDALDDAEESAKARISERGTFKGTRLGANLPVDDLIDLAIIGAAKMAKGLVHFSAWSAAMVRDHGKAIEPFLSEIYAEAKKRLPEVKRPRYIPSDRMLPAEKSITADQVMAFPSLQKMPAEARADLADLMAQHSGFQDQRRNVQTWERRRAMAQDVWLPVETLVPGVALNSEELTALKDLVATTSFEQAELAERIKANPGGVTAADQLRLKHLTDVQIAAVKSFRGAKAEAGRALNSLKDHARVLELGEAQFIDELLKRTGDLATITKGILDAQGDPLKKLKFLRDQTARSWVDLLQAYFYVNVLSGPKTHFRNVIGTSINLAQQIVNPVTAAPVSAYQAARYGTPQQVFLGEIPHGVVGALAGVSAGMRNAAFAFSHGFRPSTVAAAGEGWFDQPMVELPGGAWTNWPTRALLAEDEFMRSVARSAALYAGAYAEASKQWEAREARNAQRITVRRGAVATRRDWVASRMAAILTNVDPKTRDGAIARRLLEAADKVATRTLFQEDPGAIVSRLLLLKSSSMPALARLAMTQLMAFVKTPGNVLRQGVEFGPVGFAMKDAKKGGREGAQALGRAWMGTALLAPVIWYALEGGLTGAPPDDEGEREEFFALGKIGNAMKVGDYWIRYSLFQPANVLLTAVADAVQSWQDSAKDDKAAWESATRGMFGAAEGMLDQSFLTGINTFLEAAKDQRRVARWVEMFAQSLFPYSGAMRNLTQAVDPTVRDPEGPLESIQAIIPGQSDTVAARQDRFGQPVQRTGSWWGQTAIGRGFVVPEVSKALPDEMTQELARLAVRPTLPPSTLTEDGDRVPLTEVQKFALAEALGRERKHAIVQEMGNNRWDSLDDEEKIERIQDAMTAASRDVRRRALRTLRNTDTPSTVEFSNQRLLSARAWEALQRDQAAVK